MTDHECPQCNVIGEKHRDALDCLEGLLGAVPHLQILDKLSAIVRVMRDAGDEWESDMVCRRCFGPTRYQINVLCVDACAYPGEDKR